MSQISSFTLLSYFTISEKRIHCGVTVTKQVLINATKNQSAVCPCATLLTLDSTTSQSGKTPFMVAHEYLRFNLCTVCAMRASTYCGSLCVYDKLVPLVPRPGPGPGPEIVSSGLSYNSVRSLSVSPTSQRLLTTD